MDKNVIKQWILAGDSVKSISDAAATALDEIEQERKDKIQEAKEAIINAYDAYAKLLSGKGLSEITAQKLSKDLDIGVVRTFKDYAPTKEEEKAETGTNPKSVKSKDEEFDEVFRRFWEQIGKQRKAAGNRCFFV